MNSPLRYVGVRLFLLLLVVMLVIFSIHTYLDIRTTSSNLTDAVYESAQRASDLIVRSTRYGMLLNRKEDVHQTIRTLGTEPGFIGISIYNKNGQIIFSTDSTTIGQQLDLAAEACNICHASGSPLESVPMASRMRVYESGDGEPVLGLINPIRNEPACSNASCHAHTADQRILGVLDVKMSLAGVATQVADVRRRMIASALAMTLGVAGLSGLFIYRVIRHPIRKLKQGMETVSRGYLNTKIEVDSRDEFGELASAFNSMAADLGRTRGELENWANTLEDRVRQKTDELERTQSQVIHMEKMASLGKLSTSVAHEINNPLSGILTYSKLGLREIDEDGTDTAKLREYFEVVCRESSRCGEIVRSLLDFARSKAGRFEPQHLNVLVDQARALLTHHFELSQVEMIFHSQLADDLLVCDARQIQQALIAPCINAAEAMPDGGTLTIRTSGNADVVRIEIMDTGTGIPPEIVGHVFEPFYTTKDDQGGLGLGLSVVYGIVHRHGGHVDIHSAVGEGTTVTIELPRRQQNDEAPDSNVDEGQQNVQSEV